MKSKVLFMIHNMNLGGTEKSLLSLLAVMNPNKYDVTLLMLEKYGKFHEFIPNWVTIKYVNGFSNMKIIITQPPLQVITKLLRKWKLVDAFNILIVYVKSKLSKNWYHFYAYVLKKYKPFGNYDLAIAYAGPSDFISYFILKKINAKKKIQWIHFDITKVNSGVNFGNKFYKYFDKIFCVSKSAKDNFINYFENFKHKTDIFLNVVNEKEVQKKSIQAETFSDRFKGIRILTLGRISKEKGQHFIPNVIEKLINEGYNVRWYCIGEGSYKQELEKTINEKKLNNHLILLGAKVNPYGFLKNCDIYVQTSLHEGYGLTIHEAKIFNLPMVITNVASAEDHIKNNVNGLIVKINANSIYVGLKKILLNEKLKQLFKQNLLVENKDTTSEVNKLKDLINEN